jgi:uncharacterized protein
MAQIGVFSLTSPVFIGMLDRMSAWLDLAEIHGQEQGIDIEVLLQARLAPDMFTLLGQYQLATAFAKNAMCRLAGQTPPDFPDIEKTVADVRARISRARSIVQTITPAMLEGSATREITIPMGPNDRMTFSGEDFLLIFAMPQFYFHASMAYAILRHNGVKLGKRDFLTIGR